MTVKRFWSGLGSVVFLLVLGQAQAQPNQQQIDELMALTGFGKLINRVPDFADQALAQSKGALDGDVHEKLGEVFAQTYRPERIYQDVIQTLNSGYRPQPMADYLAFLRSPLAQKMAELERQSATPQAQGELHRFAETWQQQPADEQRVALIKRLDQASRTTAFTIDMQAAFFRGIFQAVDPLLGPDNRLGEGELESMVNEVKHSLEGPAQNVTLLSYLYAYRDVTDAELARYVEMYEAPAARWGVELLGNAMMQALEEAAQQAAALVGERMQ